MKQQLVIAGTISEAMAAEMPGVIMTPRRRDVVRGLRVSRILITPGAWALPLAWRRTLAELAYPAITAEPAPRRARLAALLERFAEAPEPGSSE